MKYDKQLVNTVTERDLSTGAVFVVAMYNSALYYCTRAYEVAARNDFCLEFTQFNGLDPQITKDKKPEFIRMVLDRMLIAQSATPFGKMVGLEAMKHGLTRVTFIKCDGFWNPTQRQDMVLLDGPPVPDNDNAPRAKVEPGPGSNYEKQAQVAGPGPLKSPFEIMQPKAFKEAETNMSRLIDHEVEKRLQVALGRAVQLLLDAKTLLEQRDNSGRAPGTFYDVTCERLGELATHLSKHWKDWKPTADNINALPTPLFRYIHDIHSDNSAEELVEANLQALLDLFSKSPEACKIEHAVSNKVRVLREKILSVLTGNGKLSGDYIQLKHREEQWQAWAERMSAWIASGPPADAEEHTAWEALTADPDAMRKGIQTTLEETLKQRNQADAHVRELNKLLDKDNKHLEELQNWRAWFFERFPRAFRDKTHAELRSKLDEEKQQALDAMAKLETQRNQAQAEVREWESWGNKMVVGCAGKQSHNSMRQIISMMINATTGPSHVEFRKEIDSLTKSRDGHAAQLYNFRVLVRGILMRAIGMPEVEGYDDDQLHKNLLTLFDKYSSELENEHEEADNERSVWLWRQLALDVMRDHGGKTKEECADLQDAVNLLDLFRNWLQQHLSERKPGRDFERLAGWQLWAAWVTQQAAGTGDAEMRDFIVCMLQEYKAKAQAK